MANGKKKLNNLDSSSSSSSSEDDSVSNNNYNTNKPELSIHTTCHWKKTLLNKGRSENLNNHAVGENNNNNAQNFDENNNDDNIEEAKNDTDDNKEENNINHNETIDGTNEKSSSTSTTTKTSISPQPGHSKYFDAVESCYNDTPTVTEQKKGTKRKRKTSDNKIVNKKLKRSAIKKTKNNFLTRDHSPLPIIIDSSSSDNESETSSSSTLTTTKKAISPQPGHSKYFDAVESCYNDTPTVTEQKKGKKRQLKTNDNKLPNKKLKRSTINNSNNFPTKNHFSSTIIIESTSSDDESSAARNIINKQISLQQLKELKNKKSKPEYKMEKISIGSVDVKIIITKEQFKKAIESARYYIFLIEEAARVLKNNCSLLIICLQDLPVNERRTPPSSPASPLSSPPSLPSPTPPSLPSPTPPSSPASPLSSPPSLPSPTPPDVMVVNDHDDNDDNAPVINVDSAAPVINVNDDDGANENAK